MTSLIIDLQGSHRGSGVGCHGYFASGRSSANLFIMLVAIACFLSLKITLSNYNVILIWKYLKSNNSFESSVTL